MKGPKESRPLHELLVAATLLGVLFLFLRCPFQPGEHVDPRSKTAADLSTISASIREYADRHGGRHPEDLQALCEPDETGDRILDRDTAPVDAWGNDYLYELLADGTGFRVTSYGADGRPGGMGPAADLIGW